MSKSTCIGNPDIRLAVRGGGGGGRTRKAHPRPLLPLLPLRAHLKHAYTPLARSSAPHPPSLPPLPARTLTSCGFCNRDGCVLPLRRCSVFCCFSLLWLLPLVSDLLASVRFCLLGPPSLLDYIRFCLLGLPSLLDSVLCLLPPSLSADLCYTFHHC